MNMESKPGTARDLRRLRDEPGELVKRVAGHFNFCPDQETCSRERLGGDSCAHFIPRQIGQYKTLTLPTQIPQSSTTTATSTMMATSRSAMGFLYAFLTA